MNSNRSILWVVLTILATSCGGSGCESRLWATPKAKEDLESLLKAYAQVLSVAKENYAESINVEKVLQASIRGMLQTLDPHSNFFDSQTYRLFQDDQRGNFFGVGISVSIINGQPTVMATQPGTPAQRLGLRSGDVIVKIDGVPSLGVSRDRVVERFRGPKGTPVRVTVQREGIRDLLDFSIIRDVIAQPSIPLAFRLRSTVGYLQIDSFTETTERELKESLTRLGPMEGLVLDLRNNPGGSLEGAIGVADQFLKQGQEVLVTRGRLTSANHHYVVPHGTDALSYAIVVLINSNSASASEIVAGALQDHDRGLILGETSFGKGLVQSVFELSLGNGIALTTAKWYTPSGRLIQREYDRKSYYDYFNGKGKPTQSTEVRYTDNGRAVYGGGGIRPDVPLPPQQLDVFQAVLLSNATFFSFIRSYNARHPQTDALFEPNKPLLDEFKEYLKARAIPFQESDFISELDFVKRRLRYEYALSHYGLEAAEKVAIEGDQQVLKALDLLPQARLLFAGAAKNIAATKRLHKSN